MFYVQDKAILSYEGKTMSDTPDYHLVSRIFGSDDEDDDVNDGDHDLDGTNDDYTCDVSLFFFVVRGTVSLRPGVRRSAGSWVTQQRDQPKECPGLPRQWDHTGGLWKVCTEPRLTQFLHLFWNEPKSCHRNLTISYLFSTELQLIWS